MLSLEEDEMRGAKTVAQPSSGDDLLKKPEKMVSLETEMESLTVTTAEEDEGSKEASEPDEESPTQEDEEDKERPTKPSAAVAETTTDDTTTPEDLSEEGEEEYAEGPRMVQPICSTDDDRHLDYGYGDDYECVIRQEDEVAEGAMDERDIYGYEDVAPRRRRSSLLGHLLVWAGAVNDEQFDEDTYAQPTARRASIDMPTRPVQVPPVEREWGVESEDDDEFGRGRGGGRRRGSARRTSARRSSGTYPRQVPPMRSRSNDDIYCDDGASNDSADEDGHHHYGAARGGMDGDDNHHHHHHHHNDDNDDEIIMPNGGRAPRRNSLHAMVERAMAYVNLKRNDDDDDLTPFGTRRDSLF